MLTSCFTNVFILLEKWIPDTDIPTEGSIVDRMTDNFEVIENLIDDPTTSNVVPPYQQLVNKTLTSLITSLTQLAWKNFYYEYGDDTLVARRLIGGVSKQLTIPRIFYRHDYPTMRMFTFCYLLLNFYLKCYPLNK